MDALIACVSVSAEASIPRTRAARGPALHAVPEHHPARNPHRSALSIDGGRLTEGASRARDVNGSLFYIDAGPNEERVRKVADKLRGWDATPGEGAGAEVNVLSPSRRSRADRLARTQRSD
ncbi:hypothetical protein [Streptomyces sp. NPDC058394]|uniref:hypothetical protein n=1 Tax=unclassified Streptomyces TaxID=2593676 RepID=UPI0036639283